MSTNLETLEARVLRTAVVGPTPYEQYAVELINRARANPTAEATRLTGFKANNDTTVYNGQLNEGVAADDTISTDAKQPLAINLSLIASARAHSDDMVANSYYGHTGSDGSDPYARIVKAGYDFASPTNRDWGENVAIDWSSDTPDPTTTVQHQQDSLFSDQGIDGRGHRVNMLEASRNEVGVGLASGPYDFPGQGTVNAFAQTADTASNGTTFLTGVAYTDTVTEDHFYTPGEGLGGVSVVATRISDGKQFDTTTWASGGYTLKLGDGLYNVVASGGGLAKPIEYDRVAVVDQNVEADFVPGESGGGAVAAATDFAKLHGTDLIINGTAASDVITVTLSKTGSQVLATLDGSTSGFDTAKVAAVSVFAGDGNDKVTIDAGMLGAYVEGGLGKDTLVGGAGNDTLYGGGGIDKIEGNAGNDLIAGQNANDYLYGGYGNDAVYGGFGNDVVDGGPGNDRLFGNVGDDTLTGDAGRDILHGGTGHDLINGGPHHDTADKTDDDTYVSVESLVEI